MPNLTLQQRLVEEYGRRNIENVALPESISTNISPKFAIRPYQKSALQYFLKQRESATIDKSMHRNSLLFHMATGSGKTLIMASSMLKLYQEGFRNFLFFVDSTTIIEKTKNNFINSQSSKYLFADSLKIDGNPIRVRSVSNFHESSDDGINIHFTTIQGLHYMLQNPSENSLTFEELQDHKIVLISDEAHHINVSTRKSASQLELIDKPSWETTVERILDANQANLLLEFTATMDMSNQSIYEKYLNRMLFDYPLKQFRIDGFSKEVAVLQRDSAFEDQILQACLISQYRKHLFLDLGQRIKPVLLFKSKTISESENFFLLFESMIRNLDEENIVRLLNSTNSTYLESFKKYLLSKKITVDNLVLELQNDFDINRCISVNSKSDSEEKQVLVNSLEEEDNLVRVIFAVDQLNEGWDVLNLFDIVRLYNTRDADNNKGGKTTTREAQLIGRGARYCPFVTETNQDKFVRKFDSEVDSPFRLCETLIYHSTYNPKYIQELNSTLMEIGIKSKESLTLKVELKEEFRKSNTFKKGFIFLNKQLKREENDPLTLKMILRFTRLSAHVDSDISRTSFAFETDTSKSTISLEAFDVKFSEVNRFVLLKALNRHEFFRFSNLQKYFPKLNSVREFIESPDYLGSIAFEVSSSLSWEILQSESKLEVLDLVLSQISEKMATGYSSYLGSLEFRPIKLDDILRDKILNINLDESGDAEFGRSMTHNLNSSFHLDLTQKSWYVHTDFYGTSEEKLLIKYIDKRMDFLEKSFKDIYLIRNEKYFRVFDFDSGNATEPDFVLILTKLDDGAEVHFQIFIEPKGQHLRLADKWKEDFLTSIKTNAKIVQLISGTEFNIWGMPFYTASEEASFDQDFLESFSAVI